jgi:protein TonB
MFSNLVESKPKGARRQAGTVASFLAHYALILGALYTSAQAETMSERPRAEQIAFVEPPKPPEVPKTPPPDLVAAPRPMKIDPMLIAPVEVPNALPDIDLTRSVTDPGEFARGTSTTPRDARSSSERSVEASQTFLEFQVEQPAMHAPNSATPSYPDILRKAGVEGEALVSFVVDTSGRVDVATFRVVRTSHDLFAAAVKSALPRMRFFPATVGDAKVRQLVQQPFAFTIVK